jgi:small-conductance mechanosensitive channel
MSTPLVGLPPLSSDDVKNIAFVAAGIAVLAIFVLASRLIARAVTQQLHRRNLPPGMVVLARRAVYVVVIALGILGAFTLAFQTANVTLVGVLVATVVAALGVQQLLQDYVSGYYVLVERHVRIGERIRVGELSGTVTEIRLRVTLLRTDEGDLAVIPNSELFSHPVTIYGKPGEPPTPGPPG